MSDCTQPSASTRFRLVAVVSIAVLLCLATGLDVAAAGANRVPPSPTLGELRADEEIWEEEGWDERNSEEGEAEGSEEESENSTPSPEECNVHATTARLVASERNDTVHLTVQYEAGEATSVKVEYWLKGDRGNFQLKRLRRQMSTRGTIQGSERLSADAMTKVGAARLFVMHLEIPGLPRYCDRYLTRRLTAKRESGHRAIWSEPPSGTQPVG